MKKTYILTPKEKEFIEDWLKVVEGEMERLEFFKKWSTKKGDRSFLDDYYRVKEGEMTIEEFREKWTSKGAWKKYITVMKHRLRRKHENSKKILQQIKEELSLLNTFFKLREIP